MMADNIWLDTHRLSMCLYRGKQEQYYGLVEVDGLYGRVDWLPPPNRPMTYAQWVGRILCFDSFVKMVDGSGLKATKTRVLA